MRRLGLVAASAVVIVAAGGAALAQGMPGMRGSVHDWGGAHVGAVAGVTFSGSYALAPAFSAPDSHVIADGLNWPIGAYSGYSLQFGNIVVGVEADLAWWNRSVEATFIPPPAGTDSFTATVGLGAMATVRGRIGFALGPVLVYGTGGFAVAEGRLAYNSVEDTDDDPAVSAFGADFDEESRRPLYGWTWGGGIEMAIGQGFSLRAEYLNLTLSSQGASFFDNQPVAAARTEMTVHEHLVRVGMSRAL